MTSRSSTTPSGTRPGTSCSRRSGARSPTPPGPGPPPRGRAGARSARPPRTEPGPGTTVGFGGLGGWRHPGRGLLAPIHFIGAAEESGLIVPMGGFVLRQALATAAEWYRRALDGATEPPYVSVNVSARQFRTPGFV